MRLVPLTAVLVAASGLPARPSPLVETVAPVVLQVPEADGPGNLTCEEARARTAVQRPESRPRRSGIVKVVPPDPTAMPQVLIRDRQVDAAALPGARPEALPLQPLEGQSEVLARISHVIRRGDGGQRVRLTFYGASHTEGDHWTGRIRRVLQDRWGDLGHGFVLPAAPFAGYRGQDVNLCRSEGWFGDWASRSSGRGDGLLGLAGVSVSSSDPQDFGWVETTHTNAQGRRVSRFEVFALGQPGGGTLRIQVDQAPERAVSTVAPCPTLQRIRVEVPDGPHRLVLAPSGDGEVRIFGVSMEREGGGAIVDALGVRGETASSWLTWEPSMAAQGLAALDPDLVVLAYGTNEANDSRWEEAAYRRELEAVLARLRAVLSPEIPCILVGPSDRGVKLSQDRYAVWDRTERVATVQREVAPLWGCAFWDWQAATGGPGSMVAWRLHDPPLAASDLIHFTPTGYALVADRFLAALLAMRS
ncbi:MAG: hypothetical protein JXB39_03815 [Deltaproteobacteria bacterium]|nr:hypothetical protein [Deltaproteobacteria bacterium]